MTLSLITKKGRNYLMNFYSIDTLLRQSADWDVQYDEEKKCVIIDNYYENPEDVYEFVQKRDVPLWKYNEERNSPNGTDYLDCRIVDKIGHPTRGWVNSIERLANVARQYWHKGDYSWRDDFEVNCFKTINVLDNKLQHYPHIDGNFDDPDDCSVINVLVYLDKVEDGGTAVYESAWIPNNEGEGLLQPVEEIMDLAYVIPAKFNRCVMFTGNKMHGAYINDYNKYKDDWRLSQVFFLHPRR